MAGKPRLIELVVVEVAELQLEVHLELDLPRLVVSHSESPGVLSLG